MKKASIFFLFFHVSSLSITVEMKFFLLACHLHMLLFVYAGERGQNNLMVSMTKREAPDDTLNRNNCQLTPCRWPRAALVCSVLLNIQ